MTGEPRTQHRDNGHPAPGAGRPVRTFIAVLLSEELKRRIGVVQEEFKKIAPAVKWVDEANFHITLKFLGNVPAERLDRVREAVAAAANGIEPFDIEVRDIGAFPSARRARTVWVGVTSGKEELAELARRVDKQLEKIGVPREDRPFRSHITIGRVKDDQGAVELGPALEQAQVGSLGSVRVASVTVMRSDLQRDGPVYSVLSEHRLEVKADG